MLVVTTTQHPLPRQVERAHLVAARCAAPFVERRGSLARLLRRHQARRAYQVGRVADEVSDGASKVWVHEGLFAARTSTRDHPLIRALGPCERVVDATLGLGQDALHIAGALGCEVLGAEASPLVFSLVEEGMARLASGTGPVAAAAARIQPRLGRAEALLDHLGADAAQAVFVAPMFAAPRPAAPGFALFRDLAVHDPLPAALVEAALRVAPRVVVKVVRGEPAPAVLSTAERLSGRALDYLVLRR